MQPKNYIQQAVVVALLMGSVQAFLGPEARAASAQHHDGSSMTTVEGAGFVDFFGYINCIKLENTDTQVILCPQAGGRVLAYSWKGKNVLYLDPEQQGWKYVPGQTPVDPCGGRFDVGPERIIARHPELWLGAWTGEITGPRQARLTSAKDAATGLQLIREFTLDAASSHLVCKQAMVNISDKPVACCHWSRTLAAGGGICLVPLTPGSRFPQSYIRYGPGPVMNYQPDDPNIRIRDGMLEVLGTPQQAKLGLDSYRGWFCYLLKNDVLFLKRYPTFPDRVYGEMAGLTISIWYYQNLMCELEPIGPYEKLAPEQSASFTEDWWLMPYRFPPKGEDVSLPEINRIVEEHQVQR